MSAWMSGIGLGLQAAQMEQSRNQQAQELAFRQQQAGINNAQEDRRFAAAQAADVRDFDAMQQYRAFQQQQAERQYQEHAAALERELAGQRASAMVYKAVGAPMQMPPMPGMAMGEGQANYSAPPQTHPLDMLDDQTLMAARPDALRAYVGAQQDRSAMAQRRQMAAAKVQQARAAGVLKYVSPEQADEFANLGFYSDGTILPDEMPIPLQKQREAQHDALAQMLATSRDANGDYTTDPAMFEHYRAIPMEMAEVAFKQKRAAEAAMQVAQVRAQNALDVAGLRATTKGAGGATVSQRLSAAKTLLSQREDEFRGVSGQKGKSGPLRQPTEQEIKWANSWRDGKKSEWGVSDEQQAHLVQVTDAWEKYNAALKNVENVIRDADSGIAAQERGILDGPNGPEAMDAADPNVLTDDDRAKFAEVMRILAK